MQELLFNALNSGAYSDLTLHCAKNEAGEGTSSSDQSHKVAVHKIVMAEASRFVAGERGNLSKQR